MKEHDSIHTLSCAFTAFYMNLFFFSPGARKNIAHWSDPGDPGRTERFHAEWWWWGRKGWLIISTGDNDVEAHNDGIFVTAVLW